MKREGEEKQEAVAMSIISKAVPVPDGKYVHSLVLPNDTLVLQITLVANQDHRDVFSVLEISYMRGCDAASQPATSHILFRKTVGLWQHKHQKL
ncbi:hypothetical protein E2C01_028169 [Portunus trituberculatus]|uniref:Uncharacterized protein n=1 Tax=Portunus trituberculatus TaxID=210409 RepID=A0A5B7EN63_PORTR|nr:hypothetical protein [Portunus trituberculatus]